MRKEIFDWLNSAEDDLKTAEILLREKVFYASAFYSQQAAEKALKAIEIHILKTSSQSHNLIELAKKTGAPEKVVEAARKLSPHYIISRYPRAASALPADLYSSREAEELLNYAKVVFEWCEKNSANSGNSSKK